MKCQGFFEKKAWYFLRGIVFFESDNLKYIRSIRHVRRGEPMKETYWNQFMMTGKIEDYLSYKMNQRKASEGGDASSADGKEKCEPDCTDRNGAVRRARGRI